MLYTYQERFSVNNDGKVKQNIFNHFIFFKYRRQAPASMRSAQQDAVSSTTLILCWARCSHAHAMRSRLLSGCVQTRFKLARVPNWSTQEACTLFPPTTPPPRSTHTHTHTSPTVHTLYLLNTYSLYLLISSIQAPFPSSIHFFYQCNNNFLLRR